MPMDQIRATNPLRSPSESPDQSPLSSGVIYFALDGRPFARSLLKWYAAAIMVGYCAIVALAMSLEWPWLQLWFDVWQPVVDVLRQIIPLFDNFGWALAAAGYSSRVNMIEHLLAFEWIVGVAIFAFLFATVLKLSREEWDRFVSLVPRHLIFFAFLGAVVLFCVALYWAVCGFGLVGGSGLYAWDRNNAALLGIGINFSGVILFGIGTQISLGGLWAGMRIDANTQNEQDGAPSG